MLGTTTFSSGTAASPVGQLHRGFSRLKRVSGFLLDTNIVSELRKGQKAHMSVLSWVHEQRDEELFISVATFGEIRMGIERLRSRDLNQVARLANWTDSLATQYRSRMLDVTLEIFEKWGQLQDIRPLPVIDAILAATVLHHDLTLVTRNVEDFRGLGLTVFDPFREA